MRLRPFVLLNLGLAASALSGCAWFSHAPVDARSVDVSPVYRSGEVPGTAAGQVALGRIALAAGRTDAAIERFRNAIAVDAQYADAYNGLGVALGMQGRFAEAVHVFRAGLARDPDAARLHNNLGYALMRAGQTDAAALSLGRALELDASNERTAANLQLLAQAHGRGEAMPLAPSVPSPAHAAVLSAAPTTPAPAEAAGRPKSAPAYEIVASHAGASTSHAGASTLDQVAPGVYEYRSSATRDAADPLSRPQTSSVAAIARPEVTDARSHRAMKQETGNPAGAPRQVVAAPQAGDVEVSNGVGIPGVAGLAAQRLSRLGAGVVRVSNNRSWTVRQTQVLYRPGHEAAARTLSQSLPLEVRLVESDALASGVNLRLVIGQDIATAPGVGFLRGKSAAAPRAVPFVAWSMHEPRSNPGQQAAIPDTGWTLGRPGRG